MPETPNAPQDQACPERREPALQQRQGKTSPAELLDGADEQSNSHRRKHLIPGREGKRVGDGSLHCGPGIDEQGNAQY